jgi:hypothetical protein
MHRDPATGQMVVTSTPSTPGSQWKKIIAGALAGAAGGAGQTGPGAGGRAFSGGYQARTGQLQQEHQQQRQEANEDFETQQKAAMANAQTSLLAFNLTKGTYELGRQQVDAAVADTERESNFEKVISAGGEGSQDLGVFASPEEMRQAFKDNPKLHDHVANGQIISIPHINASGKVDGVHGALVTPDWLSSKVNQDLPITQRVYKDGKLEERTFTIPKGSLTGQQYAQMVMGDATEAMKEWQKDQELKTQQQTAGSEATLRTAQGAQAYAAADKDKAESKQLNEAGDINSIQSNAQQIVEGSMDPTNLSKRGKTYDPTVAAANAYSMAKYGVPFEIAKAIGDYKFATNVQTYNTLNYLNSLTGRDNQSGNLGTLINMSDKLKRTQFPALNDIAQWAKLEAGNSDIPAYHAAVVETADQIAKILQGGQGGGGTSDAKLKQAQDLLNTGFNADQIRSTGTVLRNLLGNRKKEIIGDNRYLMRWHGIPAAPGATAPQGGGAGPAAGGGGPAQPGAGKIITLAAARVLPQYKGKSDAEITADAQKLGYGVR